MPNGIVFSPDFSRLYVADTGGSKRHPDSKYHDYPATVTCYALSDEGTIGEELFTIKEGSDGMAVDVKGNLYLTQGNVQVYDPEGKKSKPLKFHRTQPMSASEVLITKLFSSQLEHLSTA